MSIEMDAVPEHRPGRGARAPGLAVAVALVLALGAVAWTWTHPNMSFDNGYGMAMTRDVGFTVWAPLADSDEDRGSRITFDRLEPVFRQDGARASVEYLVCELDPTALAQDGVGAFGYGLPTRDVHRYCRSTWPAEGGDLVLGSTPRQELLVGITATQPGRTFITGHHVSYRVGWQRGSTDIAVSTRLRGRGPR